MLKPAEGCGEGDLGFTCNAHTFDYHLDLDVDFNIRHAWRRTQAQTCAQGPNYGFASRVNYADDAFAYIMRKNFGEAADGRFAL